MVLLAGSVLELVSKKKIVELKKRLLKGDPGGICEAARPLIALLQKLDQPLSLILGR